MVKTNIVISSVVTFQNFTLFWCVYWQCYI